MEPNLITVTGEVWVIGDIHGQFYDLARLCAKIDMQSDKAVFLGDYVDRGSFSIEVIVTLLVWKLDHPGKVILLRGNHECQQMTSYFNFHQECLQKYDQEVYQAFLDLFNAFPLAATINQAFLCLHGGLSLNISKANDISRIDRFHEIPSNGLFCDLVWADPTLQLNGEVKGGQIQNVERGCSFIFGREVTEQVLRESRVRCLVRGHQAEEEGYRLFSWDGKDQFPLVLTVFSAPNYCDFYNNKGACIRITEKSVQIQQYSWTQHPFLLPDFMDTFEWSFPFVAQKVGEMMFHLLQPDRNTEQEEIDLTLIRKLEIMRSILATHRNQADSNITYTYLDGRSLDNMLAHDQQAIKCIKNSRPDNFQAKRSIDLKYQKRPSSDLESPDI